MRLESYQDLSWKIQDMIDKTRRIQKIIRWYAVSAVTFTGFVIAMVVMLPLQSRLFDMQKQHLIFSRDVGVLVVDSCFQRLEEIAKQISMRLNGRQLMTEYTDGKISLPELQESLKTVFQNSLSINPELISILRFDKNQKLLLSVGKNFISKEKLGGILKSSASSFGPFFSVNKNYFLVVSPVKNKKSVVIGEDVFVFQLEKIEKMMREKLHTKLGEMSVFYVQNNELHWLLVSHSRSHVTQLLSKDYPLEKMFVNAIKNNQSGLIAKNIDGESMVLTYAPVPKRQWGVIVAADKQDLYHAVQHILLILLCIVAFILLVFAIGLSVVLKPLSGRLLLENEELQALVEKGQAELKILNQQLYRLAMHDSLTDTMTRRAFYERLDQALSHAKRYHDSFVILYIDLNDFKKMNDTYGHDVGDFILKEFSERVIKLIRNEDVLARLGGDEFALLLPGRPNNEALSDVIDRLKAGALQPMQFKALTLTLSVSVGFSVYPSDGEDLDQLLKVADERMYENKRENKKKQ